ncbi:MAG: chemotaxis protein CheA [Deltaproteobacteria bacterium]|nr:chemotaxis protein CheA [Deltaproteobacteria bacterium]
MSDEADRVRDEFLAESQEIVESLSRDLLLLDHGQKHGRADPDLVNSVFRGVHTLKGIAGMFGYRELSEIAHVLEDLLDHLRLGRVQLAQSSLDVLFEGVEVLQRLLGAIRGEVHEVDIASFRRSATALFGATAAPVTDPLAAYDLDPSMLGVLTEYEEHRLRTNAEMRVPLYRLRVRFALSSIDTDLDGLKSRLKPVAEIITYLPSVESSGDDTIELEVLLASATPLSDLRQLVGDAPIDAIATRDRPSRTMPPPPAGSGGGMVAPSVAPPAMRTGEGEGRDLAPRDAGAEAIAVRAVAKTVRVDISKLDHLMNVIGELGIVRSAVGRVLDRLGARSDLRPITAELHRIHRSFERHLEALQDGVLDVRMVPLGQTFDRLARAVRQVAREHEKEVRLVVNGGDTEIDKLIVEELIDPLLHLIRNAVGHGIESRDQRARIGKDPTGIIALNAYQKGNHVVIEVEDDGAGIDAQRVLARAVERKLLDIQSARDLDDQEIKQLVFLPGFSTADEVTDLSGRGVGLDVVRTNIGRLGGVIDLHSTTGIGTKFTLTLPITLAILSALVMRVGNHTFAIPLTVVQEALFLDPNAIRVVDGREMITLRGQSLPVVRLAELFRTGDPPRQRGYVVVTSLGQRRLGIVVDALEGQQDIVTKALGPSLASVRGFAGATDLGDQRVVLVLDAPSLLDEVLSADTRVASSSSHDLARGGPS